MKPAILPGFALLLAGCQTSAPPLYPQIPPHTAPVAVCGSGDVMMQTSLWFGLARAKGAPVSPGEWQQFEHDQVTPRFKDNYLVYDAMAQGQRYKVLMALHVPDLPGSDNINALREHYRSRFDQASVTRVDGLVCVAQ